MGNRGFDDWRGWGGGEEREERMRVQISSDRDGVEGARKDSVGM